VLREASGFGSSVAVSAGAGVAEPEVAAAGGYAVVAWVSAETVRTDTTTRVSAAIRLPGGTFASPQVVDSATSTQPVSGPASGETLSGPRPVIGPTGQADLLVTRTGVFQSIPGERTLAMRVWTRAPGLGSTWVGTSAAQGGAFPFDPAAAGLAAASAGDAAFVSATSTSSPVTAGTGVRAPGASDFVTGAAAFTGPVTPRTGIGMSISALSGGRYVVTVWSPSTLRAVAGRPAGAFDAPITLVAGAAAGLLGLASSGRDAVAAWPDTSSGASQLAVALYDDAAVPTGAVPTAPGRDTIVPVLSRLAVSPRRFASRRVTRGRAQSALGTRIRWRLSEPRA
jgi:hypothetical protein